MIQTSSHIHLLFTTQDGKADVSQMEGKEFVIRKTKLVLAKMDPDKVR
jgi:hypothetical protein